MARFRRVKADELVIATRQLATMVNSGMSLLRSLYVIEERPRTTSCARSSSTSGRTSRPASRCRTRCASTPDMFNDLYVAMVQAGETGGILDNTLLPRGGPAREGRRAPAPDQGGDDVPLAHRWVRLRGALCARRILVRCSEKIFKDFGGELPAITKLAERHPHDPWSRLVCDVPAHIAGSVFLFNCSGSDPRKQEAVRHLKLKLPREQRHQSRRSPWHASHARSRVSSRPACRCSRRSTSPARHRATRWSESDRRSVRESVKEGRLAHAADD